LFRELGPTALEGYRLLAPADLGALVRATLPGGFGWVGAAVTNGEGYTSRELNPGKNVEVAAAVHPLPAGRWWPVTLVAGASFGSSGLPEIATHRFGGAAMWAGRQLGVSAGLFGIFGLDGDAAQRGYVFEVTARGMLFEHVLLAARWQYLRRSTTFDDAVMDVMGAVGGRLSFVELFFAVGRTTGIGAARTALPGNDATQVRLVARARWPELNP
jgi:hypothetical protein